MPPATSGHPFAIGLETGDIAATMNELASLWKGEGDEKIPGQMKQVTFGALDFARFERPLNHTKAAKME